MFSITGHELNHLLRFKRQHADAAPVSFIVLSVKRNQLIDILITEGDGLDHVEHFRAHLVLVVHAEFRVGHVGLVDPVLEVQEVVDKGDDQAQEEPENQPVNNVVELGRLLADIRTPDAEEVKRVADQQHVTEYCVVEENVTTRHVHQTP